MARHVRYPNWQVAHKTGTSPTVEGITVATNDVGIIFTPDGRKIAIAVFVADSSETSHMRAATIAAAARLVVQAFR